MSLLFSPRQECGVKSAAAAPRRQYAAASIQGSRQLSHTPRAGVHAAGQTGSEPKLPKRAPCSRRRSRVSLRVAPSGPRNEHVTWKSRQPRAHLQQKTLVMVYGYFDEAGNSSRSHEEVRGREQGCRRRAFLAGAMRSVLAVVYTPYHLTMERDGRHEPSEPVQRSTKVPRD